MNEVQLVKEMFGLFQSTENIQRTSLHLLVALCNKLVVGLVDGRRIAFLLETDDLSVQAMLECSSIAHISAEPIKNFKAELLRIVHNKQKRPVTVDNLRGNLPPGLVCHKRIIRHCYCGSMRHLVHVKRSVP